MPKRSTRSKTPSQKGQRSAPKKRSTKKKTPWSVPPKEKQPERLQRLLAAAGYGSRRQCEELIAAGRVEVDGEIVTKLGTTADSEKNKVRVDGVFLRRQKKVYYAVNKPTGVVTTNSDPHGRARVIDLVPRTERVFPVGRLDLSSEGLILLTNDGDLAQQLAHPKYAVRKVYRVTVAGKVESETMRKMRTGIYIAEGLVKVEGARILKSRPRATELEIVLREGKNREIRRILARMGHKVQSLRRIAIGSLKLGEVPPGAYRLVSREEVRKLQQDAEASRIAGEAQALAEPRKSRTAKKSAGKKTTGKTGSTKRASGKPSSTTKSRGAGKQSRTGQPSSTGKRAPQKSSATKSGQKQFNIKVPGFESEYESGAVIGGDGVEPEQPKRSQRGTKKRGAKQTATGTASKRAPAKRGVKKKQATKKRGKKATAAAPRGGATGGRRGAARTAKKSTAKRSSKKSVGRKRKR